MSWTLLFLVCIMFPNALSFLLDTLHLVFLLRLSLFCVGVGSEGWGAGIWGMFLSLWRVVLPKLASLFLYIIISLSSLNMPPDSHWDCRVSTDNSADNLNNVLKMFVNIWQFGYNMGNCHVTGLSFMKAIELYKARCPHSLQSCCLVLVP